MKLFLIVCFLNAAAFESVEARLTYSTVEADTIYSYDDVDTKPALEKGIETLYKSWSFYVRYPGEAKKNRIEGKVYLSFVIDETGTLIDPKVEKGLGYGIDEAAVNALLKTELKWVPGTKDGKNVKVRLFLPFSFRLR